MTVHLATIPRPHAFPVMLGEIAACLAEEGRGY
jgi:hypothetical protein